MAKKTKKNSKKTGKKAPRRSRFAQAFSEAEAEEPRDPMFDVGTFEVQFMGLEMSEPIPGKDEWCRAKFDSEETGPRVALYCMSSKALATSVKRLKGLLMAVIGCSDLEEYNEFDPEGGFLDAMLGEDNDYSEMVEQYIGADVTAVVSRGNSTPDEKDFYRNVSFRIGGDEEDEEEED